MDGGFRYSSPERRWPLETSSLLVPVRSPPVALPGGSDGNAFRDATVCCLELELVHGAEIDLVAVDLLTGVGILQLITQVVVNPFHPKLVVTRRILQTQGRHVVAQECRARRRRGARGRPRKHVVTVGARRGVETVDAPLGREVVARLHE